jgi:hypothetical protein
MYNALQQFRGLYSTIPVFEAMLLLDVALEPGRTKIEVTNKLGLTGSTGNRAIANLSDFTYKKETGLGLLQYGTNIQNLSEKPVELTPKGQQFVDRIAEIIKGRPQDGHTEAR